MINLSQGFQHEPAFLRKVLCHLHKTASAVRDTVPQDDLQGLGQVARQGIAHLDRRSQIGSSTGQHRDKISPGVRSAGEEQAYPWPSWGGVIPRRNNSS